MNQGFWDKLREQKLAQGEPFFVLAPMADVTDLPFRTIVAECGRPASPKTASRGGPDLFYTEFIACDGLCSKGRDKLLPLLAFEAHERPIVAQFFGSKPENFFQCAQLAVELGFDGIDINMGCPDRKIMKQGAGISLCKDFKLAQEIIAATRAGAGALPVSVKTRLGLNAVQLKNWIQPLLDMKLPALVIHARTAKEMSKVPAHWDIMKQVVEMAQGTDTLIIGNGDIMSRAEGIQRAKESGVDGIMVGRGIFHNPWLFNSEKDQTTITPQERIKLLKHHTELFTQFWGTRKNFDVLKRFYKIYISNWDGAKELRTQLMQTKNTDQVYEIINPLLSEK